jgi:hypothetical protein
MRYREALLLATDVLISRVGDTGPQSPIPIKADL